MTVRVHTSNFQQIGMHGLDIGYRRKPQGAAVAFDSLITILTNATLTTNLKVCLDAGDSSSYTSGQSWLDRSGNGQDFFLGVSSGSEASDPTFNGSAGGLSSSEYFSVDGGDNFRYDTTNETWMTNLHKNGSILTAIAMIFLPTGYSSGGAVFGTTGNALGAGFEVKFDGPNSRAPRALAYNTTTTAGDWQGATDFNTNAWNMLGLSFNENGGNVSFLYTNGAYNQVSGSNTFDGNFTAPETTNANQTLEILADGNGANRVATGVRIGGIAFWDTALSKANLDTIWTAWKSRYGL